MALVSPGVSITVTDQSQYVSSAIGTVPLVVLATAQDKLNPSGTVATGTTKANADKLQIFTSQRDLITALGYPTFLQSSAGTPLHGNELNEYGLMAAYSALGLGNQLYAIRADIDLNALHGTSVRPTGKVMDGTYWLDLADTTWGIYEWSADTQSFTNQQPILITSAGDVDTADATAIYNGTAITLAAEPKPKNSIGAVGQYAIVTTPNTAGAYNNRVYHKGSDNAWKLVGSKEWQNDLPVATGSVSNPTFTNTVATGGSINGTTITLTTTNIDSVISSINGLAIAGVKAAKRDSKLCLFANDLASSGTGVLSIVEAATVVSNSLWVQAGIITPAQFVSNGTYRFYAPQIQFSNYAGVPAWTMNDSAPQANGAVWLKSGKLGGGSNLVFKKYNATTDTWTTQAAVADTSEGNAISDLDVGGGSQIGVGTLFVYEDQNTYDATTDNLGIAGFTPMVRSMPGELAITGVTPGFGSSTGTFTLKATTPGTNTFTTVTVTVSAATAASFVSGIQAAVGTPGSGLQGYITASVNSSTGTITVKHLAGGTIIMSKIAGQPNLPYLAGFTSAVEGVRSYGGNDSTNVVRILSGFSALMYEPNIDLPVADPADGTLWYYSDPTIVDVMINTGTKWVGYKTLSADARGYNLTRTDANGVIVEFTAPTTQSNGTSPLVPGDLWLDTSDLENWPKMNRWNGTTWVAIDNSDALSVNGIVFADARWDGALSGLTSGTTNGGTTDPAVNTEDPVASLLYSNYVDLDAPNPELYPRGVLLFNTRRSGYNVKRYVANYFNAESFMVNDYSSTTTYNYGDKVYYGSTIYVSSQSSNTGNTPPDMAAYWSPLQSASWVTASGLKNDGSPNAGHYAQRHLIVSAMNAAVEANTQIREDQFGFSLLAAPGYPELITNMVALNNDRKNTAFIIGDTPMSLSTNVVDLNNWSNDTNGDGLPTDDPYCAVYWPSALSTDLSGNTIMVPPSHIALRTYLHNDNLAYPWFAPAGLRRGLVDNATDLGYVDYKTGEFHRTGVNQGLRDALYQLKINPITILPGTGLVVWGQKTRDPIAESMDRVNVSRLVNYIRTLLSTATNGFLFEPNDKITRDQVGAVISNALNDLVSKRGIYDYVVVCDTSNNPPNVIAQNQLYIDIAIAPTKAIEFIYIPIRLVNPTSGKA